MKRAVTWLLVIVVIGAAVGGALWLRNRRAQESAEIEVLRTAEVTRDDLEITTTASGGVNVSRRADLAFQAPGMVRSVDVEVGDRVQQGQELARLDEAALRDAVHQAELELAQAELNLDSLQTPVDEEEVELAELSIQEASQAMAVAEASRQLSEARAAQNQALAQRLEENTREAYEGYLDALRDLGLPDAYAAGVTAAYMEAQGNVGITQLRSDHAIQQARSQWLAAYQRYEQGQRNLELLQQGPEDDQVRSLELQLEQVRVSLEQAQADLAAAVLTAPFDGIVSAVNVRPDTASPAGLPAMALLDDSALYVDLTVDEIDIGAVEEGQTVRIVLDAYPDALLEASVERVSLLPEIVGGVTVYPVRVRLTDTAGTEPRDGMTASATIVTGRREDVLLVPNWAIRTDQTSDQVYTYCICVEGEELRRVAVELGARGESWTEVVSGLEEGATVALITESRDLLEMQGPPSMGQP